MKILIGIPTYNFQIHAGVLMSLYKVNSGSRHEIELTINSVPCIPYARNEIVKAALKKDMDYVLFWDSDIEVLKKPFLDEMVELSRKEGNAIVCAPYLIKIPERRFNLVIRNGQEWDFVREVKREPFGVDGGGTGLMLIPTKIFKQMESPYFQMLVREEDFWPEDWDFCVRAKEKGFKTIVDPTIGTKHWGISNWTYNL